MWQHQASCSKKHQVPTSNCTLPAGGFIFNSQQQANGNSRQTIAANRWQYQSSDSTFNSYKQAVVTATRGSRKQVIAASKLQQEHLIATNKLYLASKWLHSQQAAASLRQQQASGSKKEPLLASKRYQQLSGFNEKALAKNKCQAQRNVVASKWKLQVIQATHLAKNKEQQQSSVSTCKAASKWQKHVRSSRRRTSSKKAVATIVWQLILSCSQQASGCIRRRQQQATATASQWQQKASGSRK